VGSAALVFSMYVCTLIFACVDPFLHQRCLIRPSD
jgi:hypothetical protein